MLLDHHPDYHPLLLLRRREQLRVRRQQLRLQLRLQLRVRLQQQLRLQLRQQLQLRLRLQRQLLLTHGTYDPRAGARGSTRMKLRPRRQSLRGRSGIMTLCRSG